MSDKQWWEPLIEDDGKLDWLCDHEGDYSEKINELWTQFTALREQLKEAQNWGEPVAIVSDIYSSRYTIEWCGQDYSEGTKLYLKKEEGK